MIVKMHMSPNVQTIVPDTTPSEAVKLMRQKSVRRLVVTQADEVVGIVCHRDLTRAAERKGTSKEVSRIREVMKSPVVTVGLDDPIEKAAQAMTRHHIGSLVVLSGGKLAGIITESDIFRALASLLTGHGNSVRIMFDITEGDDVLDYLVKTTKEKKLNLRSFLTFENGDRLLAVARIRGEGTREYMDKLWDSGHTVVNVVYLA